MDNRQSEFEETPQAQGINRRYAWKERTYVVPTPSRKGFQWKASALNGLQRLERRSPSRQQVMVVVPALYSRMPAEIMALGWLNEIDALATIRHRIRLVAKLLGWDVFTFHTRHNLDSFFDSTIKAVRETWLKEGALSSDAMAQTRQRFGAAYDYHRVEARLVENLIIQSSLMDWLTVHSAERPLKLHVIGTGLLSALVWSAALTLERAVRTAVDIGICWDAKLADLAGDDIRQSGIRPTAENLGWRQFHRVRQVIEGRELLSFPVDPADLPQPDAPSRPFWFSPTAKDEPIRIDTSRDVRMALEAMNFASWSPEVPKQTQQDRRATGQIRGWLASPMHSAAAACHWSVYNYLLATPAASLLFLDHIATLGPVNPLPMPQNVFGNRDAATYPSARTSETRSEPGY